MNPILTPADRSFNYGDGIFTTIQVRNGELLLWPLHLQRLQQGVARLGITAPDWQQLAQQVQDAISQPQQVVKVLISRGEGGRGYSPAGINQAGIYISTAPMPDYSHWQQQGVRLGLAQLRLSVQPLLAGLKHNNRLEQVLLKQEQLRRGSDDLLVLDQQGFITEAIAANVFLYRDGNWHTPALERAGVAGVMRQHLLARLGGCEVNWRQEQLEQIDAMFICNALMGIVPVRQLDQRQLDIVPVQQLGRQLVC